MSDLRTMSPAILRCSGCGSLMTDDELVRERGKRPSLMSCCPERKMVPVAITSTAEALQQFTEYFVRNYPGPNTVIFDPKWHAPKVFRAAVNALVTHVTEAALSEEEETLTPEEAWTILCETPDITSPEEYPDHALITFEQLRSYMERTAHTTASADVQDTARLWRPIADADISITNIITIPDLTVRNSDRYWVKDEDGRIYEACWTDHRDGYWWDIEGESPVDPIEFMPHPLDKRFPRQEGGAV